MTSWANTGSIRGPQGHAGPQGTAGTGINLKGSVPTFSALPTSNRQQGDAYIVQDENDSLYIWNASGSAWVNAGPISGPAGPTGSVGPAGPTGPSGPVGVAGVAGPQGIQGPIGATGAAAAQGVRGTGWFVGSDPPPVLIPGQVTGDLYFDQSNGDLGDPGMKLAEAFSAFSAEVNATPANALVPLSLIKDHSAATGAITYGYVWRLGHPQTPVLLSFSNSSKVQGYNSSSSSARLQLGIESAYTNDSSNGGYGSFSATLFSVNAGLSHYARVAVACIEGRRKNAPTRADLAAGSWPPVAERIGRSPWP